MMLDDETDFLEVLEVCSRVHSYMEFRATLAYTEK